MAASLTKDISQELPVRAIAALDEHAAEQASDGAPRLAPLTRKWQVLPASRLRVKLRFRRLDDDEHRIEPLLKIEGDETVDLLRSLLSGRRRLLRDGITALAIRASQESIGAVIETFTESSGSMGKHGEIAIAIASILSDLVQRANRRQLGEIFAAFGRVLEHVSASPSEDLEMLAYVLFESVISNPGSDLSPIQDTIRRYQKKLARTRSWPQLRQIIERSP